VRGTALRTERAARLARDRLDARSLDWCAGAVVHEPAERRAARLQGLRDVGVRLAALARKRGLKRGGTLAAKLLRASVRGIGQFELGPELRRVGRSRSREVSLCMQGLRRAPSRVEDPAERERGHQHERAVRFA